MDTARWPDSPREPDFEWVFRDPARAFGDPMNVLYQHGVADDDKRLILRRWEQMVRARAPGTADGGAATLSHIRDALERLSGARRVATERLLAKEARIEAG